MSRLPYLQKDDLDELGVQVWDALAATRGLGAVTPEGGLAGPFNAFVHAPEIGSRMSSLGFALRQKMSVPRRTIELVIITVGAHWKAEYEWWAHARMAREHGVSDAIIDAIRSGEDPPFDSEGDRAVYAMTRALLEHGQIDAATYTEAHAAVGDQGMAELITLAGYYTTISFLLNGFAVPLPPGIAPEWGD
jgi:4-carboxymuconolactone decarboxylase